MSIQQKTTNTQRLAVAKTIKLFINGEFPRTESGRSFPVYTYSKKSKSKSAGAKKSDDNIYAHLSLASRKDFRNAVTAAQTAQPSWASKTAYNRGQILYRMAEMMEGKRDEFIETLTLTLGYTSQQAQQTIDQSIDTLIYYAGFSDKYQQVIGAVNPVAGPHHNFTTPEAVGVVAVIASEFFNLVELVACLASIVVSGNAAVVLMVTEGAALLAPLAEVFATSDLPKGVINLLTGDLKELYTHFGNHMEVHSLCYLGNNSKIATELKELTASNLKRFVGASAFTNLTALEPILSFVEYKTVWHPIGK